MQLSEESSQLVEEERPRPQGSSPVEEFPEAAKYIDTETEADLHHKQKTKRTGFGSMFERRTTPKMSKLKEVHSPEGGVIVRTPKDGCAEGLVYSSGSKEGIFIKEVVPESPASKSLKVKEGDQILSATVYFDNVPYKDAIQILEHAQAYKVKLCLKRKPDITETEPGIESDVIPEEEMSSAEMREQGKTKRRGDARISWPKFPSFGKGRKSRFTRSHSSSEADEQRKLELSPTTSDTESPIKSQDALKGKKKHKIKLSGLTKRGRISSSEDTEAPTTAPTSGDVQQAQESDMLSPESLEGLLAETAEGHKPDDLKMDEDTEQNTQREPSLPQTVELISLESTLKTEDPTVPPTEHKSPSEAKPADGKKKKKDRLELKMKILGKDRSHKKDPKAISSPKRLKTLGASLEKEHEPETGVPQKPNVEKHTTEGTKIIEDPYERLSKSAGSTAELPKREDIQIPGMEDVSTSTATAVQEPFRDDNEENHSEAVQLSIDVKSVKEAVSKLPGFKLPQVDTSGVPIPEQITVIDANAQRISVKTPTKVSETKAKQEAQQEPSDLKETCIPTVEITTALTPLASEGLLGDATGDATDPQKKTKSQSKEDDTIKREQITISWVETPQKLSILHKDESEPVSGTTDMKPENESAKESNQKTDSPTMTTHSFRTRTPDTGTSDFGTRTDFCSIKTSEMSGVEVGSLVDESTAKKGSSCQFVTEENVSVEDEDMSVDGVEKRKGGRFKLPHIDISLPKVKGPKSDIEASKKEVTITQAKAEIPEAFEADVTTRGTDIYIPEQKIEIKETEIGTCETQTEAGGYESRFKMPKLGIKIPKIKGSDTDVKSSKKDADEGVKVTSLRDEVQLPEANVSLEGIDKFLLEQTDAETPEKQAKPLETEDEPKGKSKKSMFGVKLTKIKGPDIDFSLTKKSTETTQEKAEAQIPAASETNGTEKRTRTDRPQVGLQPQETDRERDVQAGKFKMPKLGIKMPKVKGPELDLSLQMKDPDVTQPTAEVQLAEVSVTDVPTDVSMLYEKTETEEPKIKPKQPGGEHDRHSSKFKMPSLVNAMPKATESGLLRKEEEVKASDASGGELQASAEEETEASKITEKQAEGSKLKTFQIPKFTASAGSSDASLENKDPEIPDAPMKISDKSIAVCSETGDTKEGSSPQVKPRAADVDELTSKFKLQKTPKPQLDQTVEVRSVGADVLGEVSATCSEPSSVKTTSEPEQDGTESKFKMPYLSFSMPKVMGPKSETTQSKRRADVTVPGDRREVTESEVELQKEEASAAEVDSDGKTPEPQLLDTEGHPEKEKTKKFGLKMPKLKVPDLQLGLSKTTSTVTGESREDTALHDPNLSAPQRETETNLQGNETKVGLPEVSKTDVSLGKAEILIPEGRVEMEKAELKVKTPQSHHELTGQGSRFKIPKLGITFPKVKGTETDFNISKDADVTLEVAKTENKLTDAELREPSTNVDMKAPGAQSSDVDQSLSKFKMPSFKLPTIGITPQKISAEKPDSENADEVNMSVDVSQSDPDVPEATGELMKEDEVEKQLDGEAGVKHKKTKFSIPKFSFSKPSAKVAEVLSFRTEEDETPEQKMSVKESSLSITNVDTTLPEVEVKLHDADLKNKFAEVDTRTPEIKVEAKITEDSSKFKMPTFKLIKLGGSTVTSDKPAEDIDIKVKEPDIKIPKEVLTVTIEAPSTEAPSGDVKITENEQEEKGGKFKMPSLGFSAPKSKDSQVDASLTKPGVDVSVKESKLDIKVSDTELEKPSFDVKTSSPEIKLVQKETKESPSKFKMPTFKLPKFGLGSATVDVPADVKVQGADANMEEVLTVTIEGPSTGAPSGDVKTTETEQEGKGGKFKMPSLGFSAPKSKGSEVYTSLTKPEVDVTLDGLKEEAKFPDSESKKYSVEVSTKTPGIQIETRNTEDSPSKFKMPTFKLPKFGLGSATVDVPADVQLQGPDANMEEVLSVTIEAPSGDVKITETEQEGKGGKFKMPSLGFSAPKSKGSEVDVSLTKPGVDVSLKESKLDIKVSDTELEKPSFDVKTSSPEIKLAQKETKESPSKFKMPTFKLPKFGLGSATVDVPAVDKDVKIQGPDANIEEVLTVTIEGPSTGAPSGDVKTTETEQEGKGGKFKMPSLGFSAPKSKGSEVDVSLTKPGVDVSLKESKLDIKVSDTELEKPSFDVKTSSPEIKLAQKETKESPSKFKMPTFKLPKFGLGSATVDVPADVKVQGADANMEEDLSVTIEAPSGDVKTTETEQEGKGGKFKMPSLGFSAPKSKGSEVDVSLTKPGVDVSLKESKLDIKVSDTELEKPSFDVKTSSPEIKLVQKETKESPSKFKMPTLKLPKFGLGSATVDVPAVDKDIKIQGLDANMEEVLTVTIEGPSEKVNITESEIQGKGGKFKMPSLGFSAPKSKDSQVDVSLTKPGVDVSLKESKLDIKVSDTELEKPSFDVKTSSPEIKIAQKETKESPSKFKMPTFKLPKFGLGSATVDVPADVQLQGADANIEEDLSVTIEAPSGDVKTTETEQEGKGGKFKMPSLGFSAPKSKGSEVDVSLTKPGVDVSVKESKLDIKVSDTELEKPSFDVKTSSPEIKIAQKETKESPSKFKMPTFKLPKFGLGSATVDVPAVDKDVKIQGPDANMEEVLTVTIEGPSENVNITEREIQGKGGKFKMPSLGISTPKSKESELDVSLSKPEVDVTLDGLKEEAKFPDSESKKYSVEVSTKTPGIQIENKNTEGSPSKFKMPTFKLPKFGLGSATVDVPADVKVQGADANMEEDLSVTIEAPSGDVKTTETEQEGKGGKFKMPSLGFSAPKSKDSQVDVSLTKPGVDVSVKESKLDIKVSDTELEKPSFDVKTSSPEIKLVQKETKESPSKFKMPTFKLPKFGLGSATVDVPADVKVQGADANMEEDLSVTIEAPSGDVKTTKTEQEGKGGKFKMPSLGFSAPKSKESEFDVNLTKPAVADIQPTDTKLEMSLVSECDTKAPAIKVSAKDSEESPSKFKMPSFSLPKFGSAPPATVKATDLDKEVKLDLSESSAEVKPVDVETKDPLGSVSASDVLETKSDVKEKKASWTLPRFSFSKTSTKAPEVDMDVQVDLSTLDTQTQKQAPESIISTSADEGSGADLDTKIKKTRFSLPKFSFSKQISKDSAEDVTLRTGEVSLQEETVKIKPPDINVRPPDSETLGYSTDSKLEKPAFGITMPKVKDVNISQKDVNIKVEIPDVDVKTIQPHVAVEMKAPEIKAPAGNVESSPLQPQIPAGTLSRGGALLLQKEEAQGNKETMDKEILSVDVKGSKPNTDVRVMLPEFKAEVELPRAEVKDSIDSSADVPTTEFDPKLKRPNWEFPKISFSRTVEKADAHTNQETSNVTTESTEVCQSEVTVKGPGGLSSAIESSAAGPDLHVKKSKFSFPKISFSKSSTKDVQVMTHPPHGGVFGPDVGADVEGPQTTLQASELEAADVGKRSTLKCEMISIAQPKPEGPEIHVKLAHSDTKEVEFSQEKVKDHWIGGDTGIYEVEDKPKDARGSPLKFTMPTLKLPKFGSASHHVTSDAESAEKVMKTDMTKLKEDESIPVKPPSTDATDDSKAAGSDADTPKSGTDAPSHGSPSKFKLPSFKMPKLSLSRRKPEEQRGSVDDKLKEDQLEVKAEEKGESQTSKVTLTTFGEIFKAIDVEFDVSNKAEKSLENSGEIPEMEKNTQKPSEVKESETKSKQDTPKSPEKAGWFMLPKIGMSLQSEPPSVSERGEPTGERSPPRETVEDEISPTSSLHSSDAFADVSSTITSEHVGVSVSSPTKVTVKYFDPVLVGPEERTGDIFTSTTKTELISDVPNLPEKVTIPSSGVTSSSEDTLRLDTGKIHAVTSNIQATPEAQHATLLTAVQMQPVEDDPVKCDAAVSWAAEDPLSGRRTVFESSAVWETSDERSHTKETVVITKQVTSIFDTTELISGETASSIQRLKHTVHSEKMKFFDEGEK